MADNPASKAASRLIRIAFSMDGLAADSVDPKQERGLDHQRPDRQGRFAHFGCLFLSSPSLLKSLFAPWLRRAKAVSVLMFANFSILIVAEFIKFEAERTISRKIAADKSDRSKMQFQRDQHGPNSGDREFDFIHCPSPSDTIRARLRACGSASCSACLRHINPSRQFVTGPPCWHRRCSAF